MPENTSSPGDGAFWLEILAHGTQWKNSLDVFFFSIFGLFGWEEVLMWKLALFLLPRRRLMSPMGQVMATV